MSSQLGIVANSSTSSSTSLGVLRFNLSAPEFVPARTSSAVQPPEGGIIANVGPGQETLSASDAEVGAGTSGLGKAKKSKDQRGPRKNRKHKRTGNAKAVHFSESDSCIYPPENTSHHQSLNARTSNSYNNTGTDDDGDDDEDHRESDAWLPDSDNLSERSELSSGTSASSNSHSNRSAVAMRSYLIDMISSSSGDPYQVEQRPSDHKSQRGRTNTGIGGTNSSQRQNRKHKSRNLAANLHRNRHENRHYVASVNGNVNYSYNVNGLGNCANTPVASVESDAPSMGTLYYPDITSADAHTGESEPGLLSALLSSLTMYQHPESEWLLMQEEWLSSRLSAEPNNELMVEKLEREKWGQWAIKAAEIERVRRMKVLEEIDHDEDRERKARMQWAVEAIERERNERISNQFLSTLTATNWFNETISAYNEDYALVCPYYKLGCRESCTRKTVAKHLQECPFVIECKPQQFNGTSGILSAQPTHKDADMDYEVVCPNTVLGCTYVGGRQEIYAHLQSCPFNGKTLEQELAERTLLKRKVILASEEERIRRIFINELSSHLGLLLPLKRQEMDVDSSDSATITSDNVGTVAAGANGSDHPTQVVRAQWLHKLLCKQMSSATEQLHSEIEEYAHSVKQLQLLRQPIYDQILLKISRIVTTLWPFSRVETYGSYATGLNSVSSDIDLAICYCDEYQSFLAVRGIIPHLHILAEYLSRDPDVQSVLTVHNVILHARVPVIKVVTTAEYGSIAVDISIDCPAHSGLATTEMVKTMLRALPPLWPLVVVIKEYLRKQELYDTYRGGLSSYALVILTMIPLLRRLRRSQEFYLSQPPAAITTATESRSPPGHMALPSAGLANNLGTRASPVCSNNGSPLGIKHKALTDGLLRTIAANLEAKVAAVINKGSASPSKLLSPPSLSEIESLLVMKAKAVVSDGKDTASLNSIGSASGPGPSGSDQELLDILIHRIYPRAVSPSVSPGVVDRSSLRLEFPSPTPPSRALYLSPPMGSPVFDVASQSARIGSPAGLSPRMPPARRHGEKGSHSPSISNSGGIGSASRGQDSPERDEIGSQSHAPAATATANATSSFGRISSITSGNNKEQRGPAGMIMTMPTLSPRVNHHHSLTRPQHAFATVSQKQRRPPSTAVLASSRTCLQEEPHEYSWSSVTAQREYGRRVALKLLNGSTAAAVAVESENPSSSPLKATATSATAMSSIESNEHSPARPRSKTYVHSTLPFPSAVAASLASYPTVDDIVLRQPVGDLLPDISPKTTQKPANPFHRPPQREPEVEIEVRMDCSAPILGELLEEFLSEFGDEWMIGKHGFSVRDGGFRFDVISQDASCPAHPQASDPLVIEDPVNVVNNVAKTCFRAVAVHGAFLDAHERLKNVTVRQNTSSSTQPLQQQYSSSAFEKTTFTAVSNTNTTSSAAAALDTDDSSVDSSSVTKSSSTVFRHSSLATTQHTSTDFSEANQRLGTKGKSRKKGQPPKTNILSEIFGIAMPEMPSNK